MKNWMKYFINQIHIWLNKLNIIRLGMEHNIFIFCNIFLARNVCDTLWLKFYFASIRARLLCELLQCCNINLINLPSHTTHKLHPLKRTFMIPFKDAFNQRCHIWMGANAGYRITDYDIAGLVNETLKQKLLDWYCCISV